MKKKEQMNLHVIQTIDSEVGSNKSIGVGKLFFYHSSLLYIYIINTFNLYILIFELFIIFLFVYLSKTTSH